MRLAILATHPIQYFAPWFRQLATCFDLEVLYAHRQDPAGQSEAGFGVNFDWDVPLLEGYRYRWLKNVYDMLRPGGYFLITTPFLVRIHCCPEDCSRWSEVGLKHLLADCGFSLDKIRTDSWGNRACVRANFARWALYRPLLHSLKNDPDFPVVVWALAQK